MYDSDDRQLDRRVVKIARVQWTPGGSLFSTGKGKQCGEVCTGAHMLPRRRLAYGVGGGGKM